MKGKGGKGQGGQRDEEEDEYMRRIRARMEIDQDPDEYSDGDGADEEEASEASGQEEEEVGSDAGSDEEEEDNEDGFAPGRGYDTEEDGSGTYACVCVFEVPTTASPPSVPKHTPLPHHHQLKKMTADTGPSSSDDEAGRAKQEALAAVRGLPLAERLALMASGALHDTEGAGGVVCTSRRRRRMAGAGAGAQGGDAAVGKAEDGVGKAKPKNKHAPTELSSKKPVPRLGAVGAGAGAAMAPTGSGKWRKARGKWLVDDMHRIVLTVLTLGCRWYTCLITDVCWHRAPASADPRFDPALGKVNYDAFRQAYGFLEGYQEKELQALQVCCVRRSHLPIISYMCGCCTFSVSGASGSLTSHAPTTGTGGHEEGQVPHQAGGAQGGDERHQAGTQRAAARGPDAGAAAWG